MALHVPESSRILTGPMRSDSTYGNNGAFLIESCEPGWRLVLIVGDGMGWEHVSVRAVTGKGEKGRGRIPTWREMTMVKDLCWDADDCVVQYHPRKQDYINCHPEVLHMWRPIDVEIPTPPTVMV